VAQLFAAGLREELDFTAEARHAEAAARALAGTRGVRVPRVHWAHTSKRVLTMEAVTGAVRVDDVASLQSAGVCPLRVRGSSKLHERSRERREVEASLSKYRFVARVGAGVEVDGSIGMDGGPSR
jgi:tRNA A-37 threonylcarbamoyl transferase component Bud32